MTAKKSAKQTVSAPQQRTPAKCFRKATGILEKIQAYEEFSPTKPSPILSRLTDSIERRRSQSPTDIHSLRELGRQNPQQVSPVKKKNVCPSHRRTRLVLRSHPGPLYSPSPVYGKKLLQRQQGMSDKDRVQDRVPTSRPNAPRPSRAISGASCGTEQGASTKEQYLGAKPRKFGTSGAKLTREQEPVSPDFSMPVKTGQHCSYSKKMPHEAASRDRNEPVVEISPRRPYRTSFCCGIQKRHMGSQQKVQETKYPMDCEEESFRVQDIEGYKFHK